MGREWQCIGMSTQQDEARAKLKRANRQIEVVEVSCPPQGINFPHIAETFGGDYAEDLKVICEQVRTFRGKYPDIYDSK